MWFPLDPTSRIALCPKKCRSRNRFLLSTMALMSKILFRRYRSWAVEIATWLTPHDCYRSAPITGPASVILGDWRCVPPADMSRCSTIRVQKPRLIRSPHQRGRAARPRQRDLLERRVGKPRGDLTGCRSYCISMFQNTGTGACSIPTTFRRIRAR